MPDDTTIRVKADTWRRLHRRKEPGDTMDGVITDLLNEANEQVENEATN